MIANKNKEIGNQTQKDTNKEGINKENKIVGKTQKETRHKINCVNVSMSICLLVFFILTCFIVCLINQR